MKPASLIMATAALVTALQQAGVWGFLIPREVERTQVCHDEKFDGKMDREMLEQYWMKANADLYRCNEDLAVCR